MPAEPVQRGAWAVTAVGALAVMAALGFGRFSYTMLLPSTREGLGLSYTAAGFLATANLVGYLIGSLVSRSLADRLGARLTGAAAVTALAIGLAWMGIARTEWDAALARALAGIAGGIVYVEALGLVAVWFPGRRKGLASGLMHTGNGAGLVLTGLGLPLLLVMSGSHGWRIGWAALALATLPIVVPTWMRFRPPADRRGAAEAGPRTPSVEPGRWPGRRTPPLAAFGSLYGLFGLSYIIYVTFFAETLRSRGLPLAESGLVWAVIGALSLASGPLWGGFSDRLGRMEGIATVFGLQALAYVAFLVPGRWLLVASAAVFGLTAWGIPAIMAAAMGDLGRADSAMTAFGRITTVMGIGQALGPVLAGFVADLTGAVNSGLWISTLAAGAGAAWSLAEAGHTPGVPVPPRQRSRV